MTVTSSGTPVIFVKAILIACFVIAPTESQSAGWGRRGHGVLTFDAATERLGVDRELARVMALGSIAPDYFEFDNPAAHAQTQDLRIDSSGKPILDPQRYGELQQESFRKSRIWREHYFDAAVLAAKSGHRERAALLLGYSLHNVQDYGTHRGMPNVLHAGLDSVGHSPDRDESRLATSKVLASIYMERFRNEIGADNWRLFNGEAVRRPGQIFAEVPAPLTSIAPGLGDWNPRAESIPPKPGYVVEAPVRGALGAAMTLLAHPACEPNCQIAAENLEKGANFINGFLSRQTELAKLLDTREIGLAYPAGVRAPETKNTERLREFIANGVLFSVDTRQFDDRNPVLHRLWALVLPNAWKQAHPDPSYWAKVGYIGQFALMSDRERLFLRQATFDSMVREEILRLQGERSEKHARMQISYKLTIEELKEMRQVYESAQQRMIERKEREEQQRNEWREKQQALINVGRPVIDGRPRPPRSPQATTPGGRPTPREPREPRERPDWEPRERPDIEGARQRICSKFDIC